MPATPPGRPLFRPGVVAAMLLGSIGAGVASAQPGDLPAFHTIGAPGNRPTIDSELPIWAQGDRLGAVGYEYRLGRTEVTASQFLPFVRAYVRHHPDAIYNSDLMGFLYIPGGPDGTDVWVPEVNRGQPVTMSWHFAARFCNWLHNDRVDASWAFEAGAYAASTFTANPDGSRNDQVSRSPGAKFWIPTREEWVKGAYYDPDRYGPGEDGYWQFPNRSNSVLISGLPELGGETNAGWNMPRERQNMPVGSYPHVQSPWGLLDLSGGVEEWTESLTIPPAPQRSRFFMGSGFGESAYFDTDGIWAVGVAASNSMGIGLRLAAVVPSPAGTWVIVGILVLRTQRRRT